MVMYFISDYLFSINIRGVVMAKSFKVARSARTGKFVKKSYANKHKSTTVTETMKRSKKGKK